MGRPWYDRKPLIDQINQKQTKYDEEHRELKRKRDAEHHIQHRPEKIAKQTAARKHLASIQTSMGRIKLFRMAQRDGLVYGCVSCHRLFFQSGVDFLGSKYWKDKLDLLEPLKVQENEDFSKKYLCETCKRYLKAKKIPPMCFKNGLTIETLPGDLKLSELEAVLCSKKIIFAKIFTLPKNTMSGTTDKVVNVPITSDKLRDTFDKITTFPRQPIDGGLLVSVKLKRKVGYKKQCLCYMRLRLHGSPC